MTTLAELKEQADHLGLAPEMVRLYGDLRLKTTWEKALIANKTITVDAVEVSAVEIADTVADEIERAEIIPFIGEIDLAECNDRRSTMLLEVARQRAILEKKPEAIADCPPPPPPAPIVRPCPIPENPPSIPWVEIAERESPRPGEGRGDERFRNLGDRLFEKIKLDVFKYLDSIHEWMFNQFADFDRLPQYDYFDAWYQIDKFQKLHKPEKIIVYEFINQAIALVTEIKQKHIPWYLQEDMPKQPIWFDTKQDDYFLILEKPEPIPLLSCHYDGEFIPNCFHEMGTDIYCFRFPNQLRAEEYFEMIVQADKYQFIPASQPQPQLVLEPQLVLAGV